MTGVGITLVPEMAVGTDPVAPSPLVTVPFVRPGPGRLVGCVWRKTAPHAPELMRLARLLVPD